MKKIEKLIGRKKDVSLRPQGLEKWIANHTNKTLTEQVLRFGLTCNYAPTPTKIPARGIATAVEYVTSKLGKDNASKLRPIACEIRSNANPPRNNMTRKQRRALKELREMKEVVILPADKGNATVLMNKEEYSTKMRNMLATPTYKELKKD